MYIYTLHGDTGLTCVGKSTPCNPLGRIRHIGILMNDDSGISTQFKCHPLAPGTRLERPANRWTAHEGEEADAVVLDQWRGFLHRAMHYPIRLGEPTRAPH